ncbi:MAG: hypothetical protein IJ013_03170 [Bacteroidaceae bacterium]|nr:hypothetical protein [Bacteroidaceae bacterium]
MIAAVAVTMGFVSSCKDYEDEMVAEFRGEDVALKGSIANLESDLEKGLADAKAEREALEQELTDEINEVKELYATKAELEAAKNEHDADVEALEAKIAGVDADLQVAKASLESTIGRVTAAEAKINTLEAAVETLKNKDAEIEQSIKTLKETLANEQATQDQKIKALEDVIPLINSDIAALQGRADSLASVAAAHDKAIADVNNLISELEAEHAADCDSLAGVLDGVQKTMKTLASKADVKKLLDALEEDMTAALDNAIAGVETTMNNLFNEVKAATEENAEAIAALEEALDAHKAEAAAELAAQALKMDSIDNALNETIAALDEELNNKIDSLDEAVDGAITELEEAIDSVEKKMQAQIDTLKQDLTDLEARVAANEEAIAELIERVDEIEEDLDNLTDAFEKRITNISIQGAYSPVLGYFNMPMGLKSNVLAAYQGAELTNTNELKFPYAYSESVVAGYETIDAAVLEKLAPTTLDIEQGEIIGTQNESGKTYAGKVYMVVNPTEVDLKDVTFSVVNSLGEVAPVELAAPVVSEDKLSFGYTRAGAALYEATAYVDAEETNVSLNVADYKDIFSDLKNRQLNVADIVSTLYNTFNQIADANAISAEWTDTLHGEEHAHTVMSDYALAAVSVKPLSFNMIPVLEDINFGTGTTLAANKVNAIIDRLVEKVKFDIQIPGIKKFDIQIDKVEIDENKFNISFNDTITIEGQTYKIFEDGQNIAYIDLSAVGGSSNAPVKVVGDKSITVEGKTVTVSYSYTEIAGEIAKIESTVNGSLEQLEAMVNQVNGMIEMLEETEAKLNNTLNNAKNTIASKLMSGIEKVANRMGSLMNKADNILRPVMLLNTTDGLSVLSQSVNRPVAVANGAVLVPTTYNAELITPIYKKYVAVTKAWDKAGNEVADITSANDGEGFNEVLEGDVHTVALNGQSGYKYEITYSALDFHGYVVNTKYYVTVK